MLFKRTIVGFLLVFLSIAGAIGNAGEGTPFITNIKYINNQQNFVWSLEQTAEGTMLIAGKTGLLEYDSRNWSIIEVPDVALILKSSADKSKIYLGGRNFIGYLSRDKQNFLKYSPLLTDTLPEGNFKEIVETGTSIYFYSTNSVICIEKATNRHRKTWNASKNLCLGLFRAGSSVYMNVVNEGVYEIQNTKLRHINSEPLLNKSIIFCQAYDKNKSLIGTDNGDLFLFDGSSFTPFLIDNDDFVRTGNLTDGVIINDNILALSTMNFGVILIDKKTGKTLHVINYNSGLPNDYIMDLCIDNQGGLWMAHSMGLSRIDTRLPLTDFSSYPGITSSIVTLKFWNNILYVAASGGVFCLDTINQYSSKEIIKRVPIANSPVKSTITVNKKEEEISGISEHGDDQEPVSDKKKRSGFFKNLFSRSQSEEKPSEKLKANEHANTEPIEIIEPEQKYEYHKYNQYVLKSKDYYFKPLPQIDKRCKLLLPIVNQLIAVTDSKLYSIESENRVNEIFNTTFIYNLIKSKYQNNQLYVVTENGIYQGILSTNKWEFQLVVESQGHTHFTDAIELDENNFLIAQYDEVVHYSLANGNTTIENIDNPYSERVAFKSANDKKYLFIGNSIYEIKFQDVKKISFEKIQETVVSNSFMSQDNNLWIQTENNSFRYFGNAHLSDKIFSFLKIFDNIADIQIDDKENLWVVDNYENIYRLNTKDFAKYKVDITVLIENIRTRAGRYLSLENAKLKYSENALTFEVIAPSYLKFNSSQYQYIIEGLMENWSEWSTQSTINVPFLPPGHYTFKVKTMNLSGEISEPQSFQFKVVPPFWRTLYFYIACLILLVVSFQVWQKYKMRKHFQEKEILQQKVKERTIELELKNKAITDSIIYAERIQKGILPVDNMIEASLKEHFVLYRPRNIVSGDFYWLSKKENLTYAVAADCTGHGVPGAFMSMLGIAYLNEILRESSSKMTAADILEKLRQRFIGLFSQETFKTNDGIDISLLIIDSKTKTIQFSGAYNPLYQVTSNKNNRIDKTNIEAMNKDKVLLVYKADRFHVGKITRTFKKFTNNVIPFSEEDTFYIFSDGFVDQFGGDDESKFKYGPFKNLILEISDKPMEVQKETLLKRFQEWKGECEQTDDILIWGLRP